MTTPCIITVAYASSQNYNPPNSNHGNTLSPLLQFLPLLLGGRQYHGTIWTVHLKEDGILPPLLINQIFWIDQFLVLLIREVILYHHIQHGTRVGDGDTGFLGVCATHFKVLWEAAWKNTPDSVCVQLQGSTGNANTGYQFGQYSHVTTRMQIYHGDLPFDFFEGQDPTQFIQMPHPP